MIVISGCGAPRCQDNDLDGFGQHCGQPDCDDQNAGRNVDCERVPAPDCDATPLATGCPCVIFASTPCYTGPSETLGQGLCAGGVQTCVNGHWGVCLGERLPEAEICDGVDQDCDGRADNGVLSPCGGCDPTCTGGVWGEGEAPFEADPAAHIALTREGWLTLTTTPVSSDSLFIPNTGDDTITRIDVATAQAVALYHSGGSGPARVAVDWRGDAFVVNREFGGVSTLRKITTDLERCVDRDMSGTIETSTDPLVALDDDECVLFTVPLGATGEVGRTIALDGFGVTFDEFTRGGQAWVGLYGGEAVLRIDGETGDVLERIPTPGFRPFASTFDGFGNLYLISLDGYLVTLPRARPSEVVIEAVPLACYLLYGLAADHDGRLLLTGFSCDQVTLHDPTTGSYRRVTTEESVRGVALASDTTHAWVAHADGRASRLALDPLRVVDTVDLGGPLETIGVATDGAARTWLVSSQEHAGASRGAATALESETGAFLAEVTLGAAPHALGDLSGGRLFGQVASLGHATHVFEGCSNEETVWERLHLASLPGADARVEVYLRHATSVEGLAASPFALITTLPGGALPQALNLPAGGVVEVRLELHAEARDGAPRVQRVGLEWRCSEFG